MFTTVKRLRSDIQAVRERDPAAAGVSTFGSRAGFATAAPVPQPPVWAQIFVAAALATLRTASGRGGVAVTVSCSTTMVACPARETATVRYFVVFAPGTCPKTAITPA